MEIFRRNNVRFIAINNGIETTVSTAKTKIHWNFLHLSISCQSGMQETSARK